MIAEYTQDYSWSNELARRKVQDLLQQADKLHLQQEHLRRQLTTGALESGNLEDQEMKIKALGVTELIVRGKAEALLAKLRQRELENIKLA